MKNIKTKREKINLESKEMYYKLKETKIRAEAYNKFKDNTEKLEEAYKIIDMLYK